MACIVDSRGFVTEVYDSDLKSHLRAGDNLADVLGVPQGTDLSGSFELKLTKMEAPISLFSSRYDSEMKSQFIVVRGGPLQATKSESDQGDYLKVIQRQKYALDQSAIVAITDVRGKIIYVNKKFCEISGYEEGELIGQDHRMINSGFHTRDFFRTLWSDISSGKVWKGEIKNKAKNGNYYWVYTTIVPLVNSDGAPEQYVAIRFDITEKKKTEDALAEERARAVHSEKMASLGIMASGIAHELGNPLGALRGRVEMLRDSVRSKQINPEHIEKMTERLLGLVDRMNKIIRGLRAYARDGSNDPYENVLLYSLVSDIVELSSQKSRKLGINLEVRCQNKEIILQGRETEIGQVIVNLLNNAMDAIAELDDKWIRVDIEDQADRIKLCIVDSGKGIEPEFVKRMLDPFFTTKPVGLGTGLGLSISNTIVKSHGGELFVDHGNPNTSFCIVLPKKQNTQQEGES
ncbi:MAG: PAS domain S-box protein [Bdellovibrionales bacterium]